MSDSGGWLAGLWIALAVMLAAIFRMVRPRAQTPINTPTRPPDPTPTNTARDVIKTAARADIGDIMDATEGPDPAGAIADASNKAKKRR